MNLATEWTVWRIDRRLRRDVPFVAASDPPRGAREPLLGRAGPGEQGRHCAASATRRPLPRTTGRPQLGRMRCASIGGSSRLSSRSSRFCCPSSVSRRSGWSRRSTRSRTSEWHVQLWRLGELSGDIATRTLFEARSTATRSCCSRCSRFSSGRARGVTSDARAPRNRRRLSSASRRRCAGGGLALRCRRAGRRSRLRPRRLGRRQGRLGVSAGALGGTLDVDGQSLPSCGASIVMSGSRRSSQRGMYHDFSPMRVRKAGTSVMRTMSASVRIAIASRSPNSSPRSDRR